MAHITVLAAGANPDYMMDRLVGEEIDWYEKVSDTTAGEVLAGDILRESYALVTESGWMHFESLADFMALCRRVLGRMPEETPVRVYDCHI